MKWTHKQPVFGDMLRMKMDSLYHFGIFVSEDEVIQFGLAPYHRPAVKACEVEVCSSDLPTFYNGSFFEVAVWNKAEEAKRRSPQDTVNYARSKLGRKGYDILYNNCEHFAYKCVFGQKYCSQTAILRDTFKNVPILDVYVAEIPQETDLLTLPPLATAQRDQEIRACGSEKVRREKYYAWKLLEHALNHAFDQPIENVRFKKNDNGKWSCSVCEFSLSHSKNAVAVALSRKAVGVDIERIVPSKSRTFAEKILNEAEQKEYFSLPQDAQTEYLIEKWTQKESLFKTLNLPYLLPNQMDTTREDAQLYTKQVTVASELYALSVSATNGRQPVYYENVDLTKI